MANPDVSAETQAETVHIAVDAEDVLLESTEDALNETKKGLYENVEEKSNPPKSYIQKAFATFGEGNQEKGVEMLKKVKASELLNPAYYASPLEQTAMLRKFFTEEVREGVYEIRFHKNTNHYRWIGAADIFGPQVTELNIDGGNGSRQVDPKRNKVGYLTEAGTYLPIEDGSVVEVVQKMVPEVVDDEMLYHDTEEEAICLDEAVVDEAEAKDYENVEVITVEDVAEGTKPGRRSSASRRRRLYAKRRAKAAADKERLAAMYEVEASSKENFLKTVQTWEGNKALSTMRKTGSMTEAERQKYATRYSTTSPNFVATPTGDYARLEETLPVHFGAKAAYPVLADRLKGSATKQEAYLRSLKDRPGISCNQANAMAVYGPTVLEKLDRAGMLQYTPWIFAQIMQESSWQPAIEGDNGHAFGLMQVNDNYHSVAKETQESLEYGLDHIIEQFQRYGSLLKGLDAYNGGANFSRSSGEKYCSHVARHVTLFDAA